MVQAVRLRGALLALGAAGCARVAPLPQPLPPAVESRPATDPPESMQPGPAPPEPTPTSVLDGEASYYSDALAGRRTASGERYDPAALTAAHRSLPFGTRVRVVRVDTGRAVLVRITDRGPFGKPSRIIDLSKAAAKELDMLRAGVIRVRVEVLPPEG